MKKMLILGHPIGTLDIVKYAKSLGVYTIVTDWYETNPAKEEADEALQISTADIEALANVVKEKNIDAVFGGISDFNMGTAIEVCERTGLPFYATKEQYEVTTDKRLFKQLCQKHDLPVIEEYQLDESFKQEDLAKIDYPVFVKPVDSAASKGTTICFNEEDLKKAFQYALGFSPRKQVIVEKYIENMADVNAYFTVQDGNLSLAAIRDKVLTFEQGRQYPPLPIAYIFPSAHLKKFREKCYPKIREMCKAIEIKNGRFDFSGFTDGENFVFYEMNYRLGGTQEWLFTEKVNGINVMKMMVNYALFGKMADSDSTKLNNPDFKYPCCELKFPVKPGVVGKIEGLTEIEEIPEVIKVHLRRKIGDKIELDGSYLQMMLGVHLCAGNKMALKKAIEKINSLLKINSTDGLDMRMTPFFYE